jgi:hypothetical protein
VASGSYPAVKSFRGSSKNEKPGAGGRDSHPSVSR